MVLRSLQCWAIGDETRKLFALVIFTVITTILYVWTRTVCQRCFAYSMLPLALFPLYLLSDLFTEIVMSDLDASQWIFWQVTCRGTIFPRVIMLTHLALPHVELVSICVCTFRRFQLGLYFSSMLDCW